MQNIAQIFATIRSTWEADRYLLDPHTAVGVAAAKQLFTNRPKAASGDNSPESTAPGAAEVGIGVATKQSLHRVCVMGCAAPAKVSLRRWRSERFLQHISNFMFEALQAVHRILCVFSFPRALLRLWGWRQ